MSSSRDSRDTKDSRDFKDSRDSRDSRDTKLDETIEKFIEVKEKIAELEKRHERYREYIEKEMNKNDREELTYKNYLIKKSVMKRETLSKKDVPQKVWDECHKTVMYSVIRVVNKNKIDKGDRANRSDRDD